MLLSLIFIFIALGIINAGYLYWQHIQYKKNQKAMVCPLDGHCEVVVESKYGKTLGFKNEILGILYLLTLGFLILFNSFYQPLADLVRLAVILIAISGFLFTTYLLYLQAFVIKKYCTWCLVAAFDNYILITLIYIYYF